MFSTTGRWTVTACYDAFIRQAATPAIVTSSFNTHFSATWTHMFNGVNFGLQLNRSLSIISVTCEFQSECATSTMVDAIIY